jgi:hypothetical protein
MYDQWQGVTGTDSQSMLDRVYQPAASANGDDRILAAMDVMEPEWDFLVEIQATLRELPWVRLQYVKGHHQDNRVSYDRLPLLAQLNVDADKRASTYQRLHGAERPFTFMSPSVGVHRVTTQGAVTAQHGGMRKRSTGPGLMAYLKQKNQSSDRVFDNVNWEAHGKAIMSSPMKQVHLTRFLHDALPTFHHENKMDGANLRCKLCGHADETTDHVIWCEAPVRVAWRQDWFCRIENFHVQHQTHPLLRHVFREAMNQWCNPETPDIVSPCLFPADARRLLIIQQNEIGWRQI